jgi:hypothetical protein
MHEKKVLRIFASGKEEAKRALKEEHVMSLIMYNVSAYCLMRLLNQGR